MKRGIADKELSPPPLTLSPERGLIRTGSVFDLLVYLESTNLVRLRLNMEVLLVLAGGLIGVVVAFITNRSADNRLKVQMDREDQTRQRERIRAIRNEPIQHLTEVISVISELIPVMSTFNLEGSETLNFDPVNRVLAVNLRAGISMDTIDENDISKAISSLTQLFTPFLRKMNGEQRKQLIDENLPGILENLQLIEGHRRRLMESLARE